MVEVQHSTKAVDTEPATSTSPMLQIIMHTRRGPIEAYRDVGVPNLHALGLVALEDEVNEVGLLRGFSVISDRLGCKLYEI